LHPCEQKGAWPGADGFLQTGQDLDSGGLDIASMDGERRVASQDGSPTQLSREGLEPARLTLDRTHDGGMGDEGRSARPLHRGKAEQCTSLERR
jgi:hypothetical protein